MTNQHPITPPPELVEEWYDSIPGSSTDWKHQFADQAAQWGADAELNYCCDELSFWGSKGMAERLRSDRRPRPPSLKEQALAELEEIMTELHNETGSAFTASAIRRALEALDD
jgi:hypothetical protein